MAGNRGASGCRWSGAGAAARRSAGPGPSSSSAATIWHNLGGLAFDTGDYPSAEGPARRAVKIREASLDADHPDVAADVAALGRADEAEALYRRALAILEHTEGADHELAVLHNNLGLAAAERRETATAEHHYRRALAIKQRLLGSHHADLAITVQNLGVLAADTGHPALARAHLETALAIFQAALPPDHPKITDCRATLASLQESPSTTTSTGS